MDKNFLQQVYNEGFADALNALEDLYEVAYDVMDDSLKHNEASVTEKALAVYFINDFLDTVRALVKEEYAVDESELDEFCDCDCENCSLAD